jgi:osmotically-inducible protein OsmY
MAALRYQAAGGCRVKTLFQFAILILLSSLTADAQQRGSAGGRYDSNIAHALNGILTSKAEYQNVRFVVEDGVVMLHGTVALASARDRLQWQAARLKHVSSVRSFITLNPAPVSDESLYQRAKDRLEQLGRQDLRLIAHDGQIRISGDVRDRREWNRVIQAMWDIPGAREVQDGLRIIND